MVANSESRREDFTIQDTQPASAKPVIDPSQFWKEGNQVKLTLQNTAPESLYMSSPYGKDVEFTGNQDAFKPRALFDQRDMFMAKAEEDKHSDPREDADERDKESIREAIKKGNIEDLKHLVADIAPEKLKRIAEQLSLGKFDVQVSKDGKLTVFDSELGLGVSIDRKGQAEVVKKDKSGSYVKDAGVNPDRLLHQLGSAYPSFIFDTQSEQIVGNNVYDVGSRDAGSPVKHGIQTSSN